MAVLGGAKVSDKLGVIDSLLEVVDALVIGGGMCFTFLAARGNPIGDSLCEEDQIERCRELLEGPKPIHLPEDIVGLDPSGQVANYGVRLPDGAKGRRSDRAPAAAFADVILDAGTVFWNGPMGMFEDLLPPVPGPSPRPSPRPRRSRSSAVATPRPPWPSSAWPIRSTTCPPAGSVPRAAGARRPPWLAAPGEAPNAHD